MKQRYGKSKITKILNYEENSKRKIPNQMAKSKAQTHQTKDIIDKNVKNRGNSIQHCVIILITIKTKQIRLLRLKINLHFCSINYVLCKVIYF